MIEPLEGRALLSGVTLITHGQGGDAGDDEIVHTANLISQRAGGASQYVLTVTDNTGAPAVSSFTLDSGSPDPSTTTTGEIVIKLDYSDVNKWPASAIGNAVASYFLTQ